MEEENPPNAGIVHSDVRRPIGTDGGDGAWDILEAGVKTVPSDALPTGFVYAGKTAEAVNDQLN